MFPISTIHNYNICDIVSQDEEPNETKSRLKKIILVKYLSKELHVFIKTIQKRIKNIRLEMVWLIRLNNIHSPDTSPPGDVIRLL